jgi:hypothetical protein
MSKDCATLFGFEDKLPFILWTREVSWENRMRWKYS